MAVRLGTEGWRGVIGDDFTLPNARAFARGVARWLWERDQAGRGVVVGYDTRFLSDRVAVEVAGILTRAGIPVRLCSHPVPTPVLSFAVRDLGAAAGLMVTASHNPPEYNGIKVKGPHGGPLFGPELATLEAALARRRPLPASPRLRPEPYDPDPAYLTHLGGLVPLPLLARAGFGIVIDPMHGAARNYLRRLLRPYGLRVRQIRSSADPRFGGVSPEPVAANLAPLKRAVRSCGAAVGLATDGDGDRLGVIDAGGRFVSPQLVYALLLDYLARERNLRGGVVKTVSTTGMIDRLADRYGLTLYQTPVGFKHISRLFMDGKAVIGGEESGGVGLSPHLPERDGLLAGLLLLEALVVRGQPLSALLEELEQVTGPHHYCRRDVRLPAGQARLASRALARLAATPEALPPSLAGRPVRGVETLDGLKLHFANGGWVLFRSSGTEPVIRLYAEAPSAGEVNRLLEAGEELLLGRPGARRAGGTYHGTPERRGAPCPSSSGSSSWSSSC
ncbi:MAG: phosphoglucomutase/phosphomannomutase family protein [Bacillota bacterium]|nr:phosphoglucomutase/phosphomannomutase family protein [Bacillota bacterium]